MQNQDDEALKDLRAASREFPSARLAQAQILARRGERTKAIGEVQAYLDSKPAAETRDAEYRREVEGWLANLRGQ